MPVQSNDYALVIGIDKYPVWNRGKRNLQGPASDAREFYKWLTDSKNGGGLPEENAHLIVSAESVDPDRPTPIGQDISYALKKINETVFLNNRGAPRRFYIFFSGHGHTIPAKPRDTNLCMAPFSEDRFGLSEALSLEDILSKVTNCLTPNELVVFLDCCRSTIVSAAGVDTTYLCPVPEENASNVREALMFATLRYRGAYEGGDVVRGHFSRALMDGLWGQAQEDGQITLGSLYRYLQLHVRNHSNTENHFQDVDMVLSPDLLEAVLGNPRKQASVRINFTPGRSGEILLEDGNLNHIHQADANTGPWELMLDKGRYMLLELSTEEELPVTIRVVEENCDVTF